MKTYKQRTEAVLAKVQAKRKQKRIAALATAGVCITTLLLVLFFPYNTNPPDVSRYRGSPYYSLIQKLNAATYTPPAYANNFEKWSDALSFRVGSSAAPGDMNMSAGADFEADSGLALPDAVPEEDAGKYVEVTDNQVQGVIEGDIFKRSEDYVFYLRGNTVYVYSIAGEASAEVAAYELPLDFDGITAWAENTQMYLSQDCTRLTLVQSFTWKTQADNGTQVRVISLDVTDPENITQAGCIYMDGSYLSSRMVDGKLLLLSSYRLQAMDFSDESTFLPQIGTPDNMQSIAPEDIVAPDSVTSTRYTVVCKLDSKTLAVEGSAAFLSYSDEVYVSRDTVFATRSFSTQWEKSSLPESSRKTATQISALRYSGESLEHLGSITVDGSVKNQYSMDQQDQILRVVTSVSYSGYIPSYAASDSNQTFFQSIRNVSLYCVDMNTWQIIASVEQFAPQGETAESVRFDGDTAYVCTAEVITLTDPVYFFDLSDLDNITWKDTGIIDGYSSSLVDFGSGCLLGIGFGGQGGLKIEIYEETADGVISVCAYENPYASFSSDYKSYFIDRENQLVGLGIIDETGYEHYLLLYFDGYELREVINAPFPGDPSTVRAFLSDGWFYMLGSAFRVEQLW